MPLATLGAVILAAGPGLAQDRVWERSAAALARAEAAPAEAASLLRESLRELERRDAERQREFSEAAARGLPAKAAGRLERARAAYQAGQGRLLEVLRQTVEGPPATRTAPGALREARQILARIERAARRQPISAELPVGAPALLPPALGATSGTATTVPMGPVPQALKDAADALPGVVEVYEWVRNGMSPEFYHGVMKGGVQAYLERSGNDADTAAVLVEMLRAKGAPARYVRGTVEWPAATLTRVVGTASVEQAVRVLERAGVPHEVVLGAGGVASVKLERVWTEAYLPYANYRGAILDGQGKVWLPLDAAFKPLDAPAGVDVVGALGLDPRAIWDEYLAATRATTPLEFVRGRLEQMLETSPGVSYDSLLNRRAFGAEVHGLLPNTLPYKVVSVTEKTYDLPDALVHRIRLRAERDSASLLDTALPVREVLGRRLTLSYEPATTEDAEVVASYGSFATTPPYLFEVKPVVRAGGVAVASGTPIGMGVPFTLRIELATPGGSRVVANTALAGNTTAIGLGGREVTAGEEGRGTAAEILSGIAYGYWRSWNEADDELADLFKVVPLRPTVSACLVSSSVEMEYAGGDARYPVRYEWKGLLIDADLRSSAPVGLESRESEASFLLMSALQGSILENRVFETRHDIPAVSTAKALGLAADQGIAILDVTSANVDEVLPGLPFDDAVQGEVRDAAARGFSVRIPSQPITHLAWTGVGYVVQDPATGEAAYQLQGGHSGGVTAPSVVDFPADLRDAVEFRQGEPRQDEGRGVARLQKLQSTDFQIGTVNQPLARPLRVLVTDGDGYPLADTWVTFSVIGGGGALVNPQGGALGEVDVRSNQDGVAQVILLLGKRTDAIPRFLLPEAGQEHPTQVGLNLVTARAELARLDEPFMALGLPDPRRDANGLSYATMALRGGTDAGFGANLRVATRLSIAAEDPYGNPLSNFPIRFAYRPLPVPSSVPGYTSLRDATASPGAVLGPADFERCVATTPVVGKGTCAGEAAEVVVRSSPLGAFAYPVLGGSPLSLYYFDIGTPLSPNVLWIAYPTTGPACYATTREACGEAGKRPDGWPSAGTRAVLVNTLGNLVEAYPPGGSATVGLWTDVVYEKERLVNRRDDETGQDHFVAEGTNEWVREHLDNSQFKLTPATAGTSVGSAGGVGNGQYEAAMTMASAPLLNTIEWEATMRPKLVPYLPFVAGQTLPGEVDPRYVDNSNPAAPRLRERVIDPNRSWSSRGTFSLWSARADLSSVDPAPIFLRENQTTAHDSSVRFAIEPAAFAQELLPVQVLFELRRGPQSVLSANGSTREPDGSFRIPADLPLAEGQYTATVSILGVAGRTAQSLVSPPVPVEAGIVTLTVDTNNDTVVDDADDEAFRKDPSKAFAFWEADPEAEGLRTLEDYATIRITLPHVAAATTPVLLSMPLAFHDGKNTWDVKRKLVSGKQYLSHRPSAESQLADTQNESLQPTDIGLGTYRAEISWVSEPSREFLIRCRPRPDGSRGCPVPVIQLEREVAGKKVAIASRRTDFLPVQSLMTFYSAHSGPIPFAPAPRLRHVPSSAPARPDVERITLLVHGFNVTEDDAEAFSYPTMFKRLYWAGHSVMQEQGAATIGISWPGDERILPETEPLYYPDDEYNALQTGVPVSIFLNQLRDRHPSIAIDAIAHSLGNMVVNSALRLSAPGVVDRYAMIDAAVPAEAFDADYAPDEQELTQMGFWARQNGYPDDAVWQDQWRTILEFSTVPACGPDVLDCSKSHYQRWQDKLRIVNPNLRPRPDYSIRWRKSRTGNSPWRGQFVSGPGGPAIYNFYNATDRVLRIDTNLPPSAWRASQTLQKPKVPGLFGVLPRDNERTQYWALLDNTSVAEEYLWARADPGKDHSAITREWAELAYWFQPLSGAVGSMPLRGVSADRNVPMSEIGGGDSPVEYLISHTYPTQRPLAEVWKLYEKLSHILRD